jgi:hypothetical protein
MSKTPFSSVKADKGLNVKVLKEYIDLMDKIKPDLVDISGKLLDISLIKEDPKRAERLSNKVSSLLDLMAEFEEYKPLIDILVDGNDIVRQFHGGSTRLVEFVDVMRFGHGELVAVLFRIFCQLFVEQEHDVHPYAEVGRMEEALFFVQAAFFDFLEMVLPRCGAHNDG